MKIASKDEMYVLYERGAFGNKLRTWNSYNELLKSFYEGTVTLRYKGKSGGRYCRYNVPFTNVQDVMEEWEQDGADITLITMNESAPDFCLVLQGELQRTPYGLTLFYSTEKLKMRDALTSSGRHAYRLEALGLLQKHLWGSSYDDIMTLLDTYSGNTTESAVIEFSAYEIEVGNCLNRNCLVWEIRSY